MPDRLIDRVLDPYFISGLSALSAEELRERIAQADGVEQQISAQRRAVHRVIDELQDELAARR